MSCMEIHAMNSNQSKLTLGSHTVKFSLFSMDSSFSNTGFGHSLKQKSQCLTVKLQIKTRKTKSKKNRLHNNFGQFLFCDFVCLCICFCVLFFPQFLRVLKSYRGGLLNYSHFLGELVNLYIVSIKSVEKCKSSSPYNI